MRQLAPGDWRVDRITEMPLVIIVITAPPPSPLWLPLEARYKRQRTTGGPLGCLSGQAVRSNPVAPVRPLLRCSHVLPRSAQQSHLHAARTQTGMAEPCCLPTPYPSASNGSFNPPPTLALGPWLTEGPSLVLGWPWNKSEEGLCRLFWAWLWVLIKHRNQTIVFPVKMLMPLFPSPLSGKTRLGQMK